MTRRILILNPPTGELGPLVEAFASAAAGDYDVQAVSDAEALIAALSERPACSLVLLDYVLGDGERTGRAIIQAVRDLRADLPITAVAERGSVDAAAEAVRTGATDFLVRGEKLDDRAATLLGKVRNLLDLIDRNRNLREQNRRLRQAAMRDRQIVGESPQIRAVVRQIDRVAAIPRPVLIVGERGTGKELIARAIHAASDTPEGPFVVVNCAAFPENLLEGELFGHEKGSFTGAEARASGKFEQADGGTLFLDEVGRMSLPFQQKILRAVEYGSFTRVGGAAEIDSTARILAATNADLEELIAKGEFLQDLYDRLAFEVLRVPPLRRRTGDVAVLTRYFLAEFMREIPALGGKALSESALDALAGYGFPGNVRELKNIIERAAYRDTTNEITPEDIGLLSAPRPPADVAAGGADFNEKVESFRRRMILDALSAAGGNQAEAARQLGLSYHKYRYYLRKYAPGT